MKRILQVVIIVAFLVITLTGGISVDRFRSTLNPTQTVKTFGQIKQASQDFFFKHPQLQEKQP